MKQETFILVTKCAAYVVGGFCVNAVTSLSQWTNSGQTPSKLEWAVIILGAGGSALISYVTFTSTALADYQRKLALTRGEKQP